MSNFPTSSEDAPRVGRSVSLDQAAQLLGVCRRTIYNRIRDGRLQTIRTPGGSQRVLLDSCRTFTAGPRDMTTDRSESKSLEP